MSKTIFVAGVHGGVGQSLANQLINDGYKVIGSARGISKVDLDLEEVIELDVLDEASVKPALEKLSQYDIGGFAYCIGSIVLKPFASANIDDFKQAYDLNVLGAVRLMKGLAGNLKRNEGSVVLFSTIAARNGFSNHSVIASAKGAVEALGLSLAADYAPDIRVNVIAPSLTETPLAQMITKSEQMVASISKMHPIPRLGQAQDLSNMAEFLLSEKSGWITGQVIHIDGGRSTIRTKG
ncbi:MAG: short-chain dehydrogenase [Rickettsiales bacterium]|nr:short-chain dehydrogenase [Rickettsiales bacterium]